jgi:RNA recognition motif-containing protein
MSSEEKTADGKVPSAEAETSKKNESGESAAHAETADSAPAKPADASSKVKAEKAGEADAAADSQDKDKSTEAGAAQQPSGGEISPAYMNAPPYNPFTAMAQSMPMTMQAMAQQPQMGMNLAPSRAIYMGNVPATATEADIIPLASSYGQLESVRIVPEKHCAFVNFVADTAATAFMAQASENQVFVCGQVVRVGWGKTRPPQSQGGHEMRAPIKPSRSVHLGNLPLMATEADIFAVASPFGPMDSVRLMPGRGFAFVNFVQESSATAFMAQASAGYPILVCGMPVRVGWAKPQSERGMGGGGMLDYGGGMQGGYGGQMGMRSAPPQQPSRSVYLGNIPETASEMDLQAMANMYGELESVRVMPDKHCAFVNFVQESSATAFMAQASAGYPILVLGMPVRVGWAKPQGESRGGGGGQYGGGMARGPPPQSPSRAVYIGNVPDTATDADIIPLASTYGQLESVRVMPEKHCAFVNFMQESSATAFMAQAEANQVFVCGQVVRVGWGKSRPR